MYKHLLFDADNTLLDFNEGERCALRGALSSSPLEFSDEVYKCYHEINEYLWKKLERGELERKRLRVLRFEMLFNKYGFCGADLGQVTDDIFRSLMIEQTQLVVGAEEVIKALWEKYGLYIITNASKSVQRKRLSKTTIGEYFSKYYISEEIGADKPGREFFDYVTRDIGDDAGSYLVIGDSLTSDIKGAVSAGLDCCYFDHNHKGTGEYSPTFVIHNLRELLDIL